MACGTLQCWLFKPYLHAVREHYRPLCGGWLAEGAPVFAERASAALARETANVRDYMPHILPEYITADLQEVLLRDAETQKMVAGAMQRMLAENQEEGLRTIFSLYSTVNPTQVAGAAGSGEGRCCWCQAPSADSEAKKSAARDACIKPLAAEFGIFFRREGLALVQAPPPESGADSPDLVKGLLALRDRAESLVGAAAFQGHPLFQKALKRSFEDVVNRSCGPPDAQPPPTISFAEVLAQYADRVQQDKDKLGEAAGECELGRVNKLFEHLKDKDVFGEVYRGLLSKRLLSWPAGRSLPTAWR
jgi:hypothetical protein